MGPQVRVGVQRLGRRGVVELAQVSEAQDRFADAGPYVVLRVDEAERQGRESIRRDRRLPYWDLLAAGRTTSTTW